tara:strand:+ start:418 stop:576 length:159 start_codon:yes stop_codon:yes gene_type:complete
MKEIIDKEKIKYIVMLRIGCGLDKLEWSKVYKLIEKIFEKTDIKIIICKLED